ncbi:MAG TPA: class I SAM-dependent methyltransferase [Chthoniobacter sp.]|nr:class I SAM-dependent methyltransferase [Chthoniobacter sp.]
MISSRKEIRGEDVASHYDELDRFYREIWGEHVHHGLWLRGDETRDVAVRQLAELVGREAAVAKGSRVVDIGCGYGATAQLLVDELGAEVTGFTISEAQYAIAKERTGGKGNPTFIFGDWLTNTLPADSFDAAIAIESSEHMDKAAFFAQARRVLRPGGRLVVNAWLSCESPTRNQERWLIEPICREGRMPHLGTETDYRQLAANAGFRLEKFQDVTQQIARTWPMIVRVFLWNLLRKPSYIRFILDPKSKNAIFGLTIVRLWLAFRTGAMRYGVFTLVKE